MEVITGVRHQLTVKQIEPSNELYLVKNANIRASIVGQVECSGGIFSSSYTQFQIQLLPYDYQIQRRYSDFSKLREYLVKQYPEYIIPPIPRKVTDKNSTKTLRYRRYALQVFLNLIIQGYWYDQVVNAFFSARTEEEVKQAVSDIRTRNIEITKLETLDGKADVEVSNMVEEFYKKEKLIIDQNQLTYKKIRGMAKKIITDNIQQRRNVIEMSSYFELLAANTKKTNEFLEQPINISGYDSSKQFFSHWSVKIDQMNDLLEEHLWHNYKYQGQVGVCVLQSFIQREQQLAQTEKQLKHLQITQLHEQEAIVNNFGYLNKSIYNQAQYAMRHEMQQLQYHMSELMLKLGFMIREVQLPQEKEIIVNM